MHLNNHIQRKIESITKFPVSIYLRESIVVGKIYLEIRTIQFLEKSGLAMIRGNLYAQMGSNDETWSKMLKAFYAIVGTKNTVSIYNNESNFTVCTVEFGMTISNIFSGYQEFSITDVDVNFVNKDKNGG